MATEFEERKKELLNLSLHEINEHVDFFKQLDDEYKLNAKNDRCKLDYVMFSPKHIINKKWRGLWLKATGIDMLLYINWLYYGLTTENNIIEGYKESHPDERYIPHSIIMANTDYLKIKEYNKGLE